MWQLKTSNELKRIYANSATGSICTQTMCYTDKDGNKWWSFDDLVAIPSVRKFASEKISMLYALGLSKIDLTTHIDGLKNLLKSNDIEKYEKAYASVLEFEIKANNATDPLKQMSSLVCIYYTFNDEDIDSFGNNLQIKKMSLLEADPAMHSFFLNRQIEAIERYNQHSNLLFQIASQMQPDQLNPLEMKSEELQSQNVI